LNSHRSVPKPQAAVTTPIVLEQELRGLHPPPKSEKEKMLEGLFYDPFSPQLMDERDRCNTALWRYNNGSAEESTRLLLDVLQATWLPPQQAPTQPRGSLGQGVRVEPPFYCAYGYN